MQLAAIYLRASSEEQDQSVPAQRKAVMAYAERQGFQVIQEYVDDGISGTSERRRAAFQRMLADGSNGAAWKTVIAWDWSRLYRPEDPIEALAQLQVLPRAGRTVIPSTAFR